MFKHHDLQMFGSQTKQISVIFTQRDPQLQVGENLNIQFSGLTVELQFRSVFTKWFTWGAYYKES